jgi:hypothetical protein
MRFWQFGRNLPRRPPNDPRQRGPSRDEGLIRLFISSTFRDLEPEREALRRGVYPIVRHACEKRGFAFFETDLRWGVTSAEAEAGRILPICLEQVDRCRPLILGILGKRYGGSAANAVEVLQARQQYEPLRPYAGRGVTELELRYAIVNCPPGSPAPVALIYGRPGWQRFDSLRQDGSYAGLVDELIAMGIPVRPTAEDLDQFAAQVRADLLEIIERLPPAQPVSSAEAAHRDMIETARLLGHRFVELPALSELKQLVHRRPARVVLLGSAGSGKTMLAAALVRSHADAVERRVVAALHPAGWRDWSEAFTAVLRQLGSEPPSAAANVREAFAATLEAAARRQPVLAIIDGVEDRNLLQDGLPAWLPDPTPGVTILVTLRTEMVQAGQLRRASWEVGEVAELTPRQAANMAEVFFAPLGRRLDPKQIAAVTVTRRRSALEQALLLDELRFVPRFEELDRAIERVSRLSGISELLDHVLVRLEAENGGPLTAVLAALALAPDGLPEGLLSFLAGDVGASLPPLRTLLLRQAIEGIAVAQGSLVTLRSSLVREAILRRIGESDRAEFQRGMVQKLWQALDVPGAPEEILRRLLVLRDWEAIGGLLLDPAVFDGLARRAPQQLRLYWARLSEARPEQRVSAYRAWSTDTPQRRRADVAELAEQLGDSDTAQLLAGSVCAEPAVDAAACVRARLVLARLAESRSNFDAAEEHLAAVEAKPLRSAIPRAAAFAAWHRASITLRRFGPDAAEKQMETRAPPGGGNDAGIAEYLLDMRAEIALERGKIKSAAANYGELLAIGERLGDLTFIAAAEAGLAKAALRRGRRCQAGQHAQQALRFARICGDANVLQDALGTAARERLAANKLDDARRLIDERLELTTRTGNRIGQLEAKIDSARLHELCQLHREAQRLFDEVIATAARDGLSFLATKLEADAAGRSKSDHM